MSEKIVPEASNIVGMSLSETAKRFKEIFKDAVYVVDGFTVGGDIKHGYGSLNDFIFTNDYMCLGSAHPDILSAEYIKARVAAQNIGGRDRCTEEEYERDEAAELRKLSENFKSKKNIVIIQWNCLLSDIWRLTMQAYIEQLQLTDNIVSIRIEEVHKTKSSGSEMVCTDCKEINILGSHEAYCKLVCNHQRVNLLKFRISEEAVDCYLDINSGCGRLEKYILEKSTKYENPYAAAGIFLRDFTEWGLGDGEFLKIACETLAKHKKFAPILQRWRKEFKALKNKAKRV